jgi:maleylacetoacetate isomerase
MIVHGYFRSSAAYRLRIAMNVKGLDYEFRPVHLRKGDQSSDAYKALNPQGLVPALETDQGAVLTQSLAIIEWLEETYPAPALLPRDPVTRAQARAFALAIACEIHPLQNLRVLRYLKAEFGQEQDGLDAWCRHWIEPGLTACEALLARGSEGDFAFGDAPSLAEICLVPQMFSAERFRLDLAPFPRLRALRERCEALPAFADAHPSKQPDAEAA